MRSCVVGDEVNIEKMAEFISQDVSLTGTLLRWANSALFGQRFQVDTIKKAIIVLGTDIVESLVLSESVNRAIMVKPPQIKGFDLTEFKKHSMATATLSRLLIKSLHCTDANLQDRAFIAGLLHDVGKLVAASFLTEKFSAALELARAQNCPLAEAEQKIYRSDHSEIGGYLAEWWALPHFIVCAIAGHHQPLPTPVDQDIVEAAYVANLLSHQFNFGLRSDRSEPEISETYRKKFYLTDETAEILRAETEKIILSLNA